MGVTELGKGMFWGKVIDDILNRRDALNASRSVEKTGKLISVEWECKLVLHSFGDAFICRRINLETHSMRLYK